jgi:transposase
LASGHCASKHPRLTGGSDPRLTDSVYEPGQIAGAQPFARLRESRVTSLLKAHRIRHIEAAEVLRILRRKPLVVASGTVEGATAHITAVAARLKLVNQQTKQAHRRLDELSDKLAEGREEDEPGRKSKRRDVTILRSLPGVGRLVLAMLLGEAAEPLHKRDYHALRTLSGVAPVTRRSASAAWF